MEPVEAPFVGGERESLIGWLAFHRDTLGWKCEGLTPEQLCERPVPPSSMSLIGLVRHMADVERSWFQRFVAGGDPAEVGPIYYGPENPDGDFDDIDPATTDSDIARWREECALADEVIAATDLDDVRYAERWDRDISMRWVMGHMVEEYARHNGHADLIRERVDGATGDSRPD
ncbi:MAG: DinB family protein [Ilumatobacteraceae bacterium]